MSHEFGFFECDYCDKHAKVVEFDPSGGEHGVVRVCPDCLMALAQELREWKPKLVKKECPFCRETVEVMVEYARNPRWFCYRGKCWDELARRNRAGEELPWAVYIPPMPASAEPWVFTSNGDAVATVTASGYWIIGKTPVEGEEANERVIVGEKE